MAIMEMKAIIAYVMFVCDDITLPDLSLTRPNHLKKQKKNTRILIAHFSFEPAYNGQVAKPTAAVTMSEFFFPKLCLFANVF